MIYDADTRFIFRVKIKLLLIGLLLCQQSPATADGSFIDKVYHPYVQALEHEIELRALVEKGAGSDTGDRTLYRLGYGQSLTDNLFAEIYLIGVKNDHALRLEAYEIEALWQLTEQGEYFADWGLLFEVEKERSEDIMEISTALLIEKDWGRWTATANLYGIYEFGGDIKDEFETAMALQARYRYSSILEPALELYTGEDTLGLGPVIMGDIAMGNARKLRWEAGVIFGMDKKTPDQTYRLLLEYEF